MRRSQRDAAASAARNKGSYNVSAGPSILQSLERMLLSACTRYLEDRTDVRRGEVRGLARAVAKIRLPYENQSITTKQVEKEFIQKAKEI